jgi:hypothetical protein
MTTPDRPGERRERVKRPEPLRTRPVRGGWLDLFDAPGSAPRATTAPSESGDVSARPDPNPLTRAVELGYRVVDEYIRQGQNAARLVAQRAYGPQAFQQDAQDLLKRMGQYTSEFWAMWFDFLGTTATGWPAAAANPPAPAPVRPPPASDNGSSSAAAPIEARSAVSVALEADRPVELYTDLRPIRDGASLRVQALRAASPDLPLLDDVTVSCGSAEDPVVVRIRIPGGHPAGTYIGVIVDETTNVPAGTIQVRIPD